MALKTAIILEAFHITSKKIVRPAVPPKNVVNKISQERFFLSVLPSYQLLRITIGEV